jgi:cleavage stimulation factor subunit 3
MADDEAENAFFQAQALNTDSQPPIEEQEGDNSDAESDDYDPSLALGDQYSASFSESKQPDAGLADASPSDETDDSIPNPTVSSDANVAPDVNADAGQTSDSPDLSQNPSPAQSSTPVPAAAESQPKTRTIGGFEVDEDEDDEGDAEYEPPAVLGGEDVTAMPVTMSEDPSSGNAMQNTSPDVSSHQAEQGPASGPVANSSYSPVPVPNIDPSSVPGQSHWSAQELQSATMQNSTVPTSVPDSPASKGRLAHDRVGMLEDRIREDPRGDIPAWLELIAEHRGRSRLDSARETYERFLKLFPMAVSIPLLPFFLLFSLPARYKIANGYTS